MAIKSISLVSKIRTWLRKFVRRWWWFKAAKIYGNHLAPTVRLSRTTILDKTNPRGVYVSDYVYFAGGTVVLSHDMCREMRAITTIGKKCFIGANAIIMPGVTIGDEVIVGAGSVVTKDIPSNSIVGGNPAKVIRQGIHTDKYGVLKKEKTE